eukprot:XP_020398573.1 vegetative cell wall protein gp1-like [Zea mays]
MDAKIERLRMLNTEAIRDKSAIENKSSNLLEKVGSLEKGNEGLDRQLSEEKVVVTKVKTEAQALRDEEIEDLVGLESSCNTLNLGRKIRFLLPTASSSPAPAAPSPPPQAPLPLQPPPLAGRAPAAIPPLFSLSLKRLLSSLLSLHRSRPARLASSLPGQLHRTERAHPQPTARPTLRPGTHAATPPRSGQPRDAHAHPSEADPSHQPTAHLPARGHPAPVRPRQAPASPPDAESVLLPPPAALLPPAARARPGQADRRQGVLKPRAAAPSAHDHGRAAAAAAPTSRPPRRPTVDSLVALSHHPARPSQLLLASPLLGSLLLPASPDQEHPPGGPTTLLFRARLSSPRLLAPACTGRHELYLTRRSRDCVSSSTTASSSGACLCPSIQSRTLFFGTESRSTLRRVVTCLDRLSSHVL